MVYYKSMLKNVSAEFLHSIYY